MSHTSSVSDATGDLMHGSSGGARGSSDVSGSQEPAAAAAAGRRLLAARPCAQLSMAQCRLMLADLRALKAAGARAMWGGVDAGSSHMDVDMLLTYVESASCSYSVLGGDALVMGDVPGLQAQYRQLVGQV